MIPVRKAFSKVPHRVLPAALFLVVGLVYSNSLNSSFHYDDAHSILNNPHIRSLHNVGEFFFDSATFSSEPSMAMYRPFLQSTYAINYALGGYDAYGYHLVNVMLHALCTGAVYTLLRIVSGSAVVGLVGGTLFGLHPVHTQAVNYISSRSELLSALGVLSSFCLIAGRRSLIAAGGAHWLALMSKSTAVTLVPLVALFQWYRPSPGWWKRLVPFACLSIAYIAIIALDGFLPRSIAQEVRPYTTQIYTQLTAIPYYLKLLAMPVSLAVEHEFHLVNELSDAAVLFSLGLVSSMVFGVARFARRNTWLGFGTGWFLAGLGLTFLVPLNVLVNEHRLYLPSVGLLFVLAAARAPYREIWKTSQVRSDTRWRPVLIWPAFCGMGLLFAILTLQRNRVWQDELTLWQDAVSKAPNMFRAQSNLALALHNSGDLLGAQVAYERAVSLNPSYSKTWNNVGTLYESLGMDERAETAFQMALKLRPDLSGALSNLGKFHLRSGKIAQAEQYLRRAVTVNPQNVEARVNLGRLWQQTGSNAKAEAEYNEALRLDPAFASAYNNLGLLYAETDRPGEALKALRRAVELAPDDRSARINLRLEELSQAGIPPAQAYREILASFPGETRLWRALAELNMRQRKWQDAVEAYEELLARSPRQQGLMLHLADAYRGAGQLEKSIAAYEAAASEDPEKTAIHNNLASAYAAHGMVDEAILACRRVLALDPDNERASSNLRKLLARGSEQSSQASRK